MIKQNVLQNNIYVQKETQKTQHLLISFIPATSVLVVGAYGSQLIRPDNVILFTSIFLLAAVATFLGERMVVSMIQSAQDRQYRALTATCHELTTTCRAFLAGDWKIKAPVQGQDELAHLAEAINLLLDRQRHLQQQINSSNPVKPTPPSPRSQNSEAAFLKKQLKLIISDLAPIANGDLRAKTSITGNVVGTIADTLNSFVEELAQFVKWTRYASQMVTTASQSILDRSIEMAKNTEHQMHLLSSTTGKTEKIVSFMQHLSNNLHLNIAISKEIQRNLQRNSENADQALDDSLLQLLNELHRQTELLESVLHSTEETSTLAVSVVGDLYTVAQQIYQSSVGALKTVERLSKLEALAAHWYNTATAFTIEEDEDKNAMKEPWLL